jgi:hypothetical protein
VEDVTSNFRVEGKVKKESDCRKQQPEFSLSAEFTALYFKRWNSP